MGYVVGLMATDGCLISGRKFLNFKSEDEQLVQTFLDCLGRPSKYGRARTRLGNTVYVAQFGDAAFYRWLQGIGLMPRKSLVLGALGVPQEFLLPCARGLLDGDGSLLNFHYAGGGKASGKRYEGFVTRFISASRPHIEWLRGQLSDLLGIEGNVAPPSPPRGCWARSITAFASPASCCPGSTQVRRCRSSSASGMFGSSTQPATAIRPRSRRPATARSMLTIEPRGKRIGMHSADSRRFRAP